MAAIICAVVNQKGGVGKTQITMSIAGTLGHRGFKVMIVDLDTQGTASVWASMAPEEMPFPAAAINLSHRKDIAKDIPREIARYVDDYDFIFVDCPPAILSEAPSVAMLIADIALIPVLGGGASAWALPEVCRLVKIARADNPELIARTVGNLNQNGAIYRDSFATLLDHELIPRLNTLIGNRNAYKEAETTGMLVTTMPGAPKVARDEVNRLVDEFLRVLGDRAGELLAAKEAKDVAAGIGIKAAKAPKAKEPKAARKAAAQEA